MNNDIGLLDIIIKKFESIDQNIIRVEERLNGMDRTLVKQEENLKEHMKRSDLLEEQMAPVKKHVALVESVFKIVGAIGVLVATAAGIVKIIEFFN